MPGKSVTLSVRLTPDDAAFLAEFSAPGATTLSEKIRAVIGEARQRRAGGSGYADCLAFLDGVLAPPLHRLREVETRAGMHSELLFQVGRWLPDMAAYVTANVPDGDEKNLKKRLDELENGAADRIFSLIEQVLRLGVTGQSPCYDEAAVSKRAETVVKLSNLVDSATNEM